MQLNRRLKMWNITKPPIVGIILLAISLLLHFTFPIAKIISYPFNLLGIALIVGGITITITAKKAFDKTKTPLTPHEGKPKKIVRQGLFRYTRNPMYLGM